MTPRHLLMAVALAGAAGLAFFGDKTPASDVAEPAERTQAVRNATVSAPAAVSRTASSSPKELPATLILALHPRGGQLGQLDDKGEGALAGDAVFRSQNWAPPAPPVVAQVHTEAPPPTVPPLPFTYLGKAVGEGSWEVYLARGDKTYSVRLHSVIDGQYRIDAIAPPMMSITYLPMKQVQQINIGVLD